MKLSIQNFKSIKELRNFEIKPFTIISGVNSAGKSSFIQLLLLIKQTIERDSSRNPLVLDGDLFRVRALRDILFNQDPNNKLSFSLLFKKAEFSKIDDPRRYTIFDAFEDYKCTVAVEYDIAESAVFLNSFSVTFDLSEGEKNQQYIKIVNSPGGKIIETNTGVFNAHLFFDSPKITDIHFSSIFPVSFDESVPETGLDQAVTGQEILARNLLNLDAIRILIESFFHSISYLGPLREQPRDEYSVVPDRHDVGTKGEFVAQILEQNESSEIDYFEMTESDGVVSYNLSKGTLLTAVEFWMCRIFRLGKHITANRKDDNIQVVFENDSGLKATIKHVGFGISQLLPIVVEGLRMPVGGTLILEQPEIHLHPKLQSLLFDFLYSLVIQGKSVVVETHSDHFIRRMRRRVAEASGTSIAEKVHLAFIESRTNENLFRSMSINELGTLDYFPEDFIDEPNSELSFILSAQRKKKNRAQ